MVNRSEGYPELRAKTKTTLSKLGQLVALFSGKYQNQNEIHLSAFFRS